MFAIRLSSSVRHRRGIALLVATLCLGASVALAHGAAAGNHMGDGMAMRLAVVVVVGAGAVATAGALLARPRVPLTIWEGWAALPAATAPGINRPERQRTKEHQR